MDSASTIAALPHENPSLREIAVAGKLLVRRAGVFGLVLLAVGAAGCQQVADGIRGAANKIAPPLKDISDVGVISELGWLSKLLRDSAQGDEECRKKAHTAVIRLFGLTDQDLARNGGQLSLAVTLEISGAKIDPAKPLHFQLRYTGGDDPKTMEDLYEKGNGWNPIAVVDEPMYRFSVTQINELIVNQLGGLPIDCKSSRSSSLVNVYCEPTAKPSFNRSTRVRFDKASEQEPIVRQQVKSSLQEFGKQIAVTAQTLTLPPSEGSIFRYTRNFGYGETNLLPFAVAFMPVAQVKDYPTVKIRAWLHLATDPTKILGQGRPIEATDFSERCTGRAGKHPTPPVDSKTLAGPVCWYAFDLLADGQRNNLAAVRAEIDALAKK